MGTEQTKPDEAEKTRILSALDERKNPYERWEFAGLLYTGIRVVGDRIAIKSILKLRDELGNEVIKMEYWRRLIETGECEVVKWPSLQYKDRYKLVYRLKGVEQLVYRLKGVDLLLVQPYDDLVPLWIMPTE